MIEMETNPGLPFIMVSPNYSVSLPVSKNASEQIALSSKAAKAQALLKFNRVALVRDIDRDRESFQRFHSLFKRAVVDQPQ